MVADWVTDGGEDMSRRTVGSLRSTLASVDPKRTPPGSQMIILWPEGSAAPERKRTAHSVVVAEPRPAADRLRAESCAESAVVAWSVERRANDNHVTQALTPRMTARRSARYPLSRAAVPGWRRRINGPAAPRSLELIRRHPQRLLWWWWSSSSSESPKAESPRLRPPPAAAPE